MAFRNRNALQLMTMLNHKTPKGEASGYLSAILYLQPHAAGGGKTLCPHSTVACREMCLAAAGLSALPRQQAAKQHRTDMWNQAPAAFLRALEGDISRLVTLAAEAQMKPVIRLNGSSDVRWELELPSLRDALWPGVQFMDYTKYPLHHRHQMPNYHLTYSVGGAADMERAVGYLRAGQSVAVVVPEHVKYGLVGFEVDIGPCSAPFVDGDEHDLRFLDPPASIVLLRPKGHIRTDLVQPDILRELRAASNRIAA